MFDDDLGPASQVMNMEPEYESLGDFLGEHLSEVYARQVSDVNEVVWCPEWWKHPEAVQRLWTLWQTWEVMSRSGPVGLSDWMLYHCEPHMERLLDPRGTFKFCSLRFGHKDYLKPLPFHLEDAPDALFTPRKRLATPIAV